MATKVFEQLAALSAPQLEAGEQVLGGVRVNQKGMTAGLAVGGLVGVAVAARANKGQTEQQSSVGLPSLQQMAFALTDRRILVFSRSVMSGKPKDYITSLALDDMVGSVCKPAKLLPKLSISFVDGQVVEFDVIKVDRAEEFASALQQQIARRAA